MGMYETPGTRMELDGDRATLRGHDIPRAKVIRANGSTVVIKVPGHKYWAQLPPHSYSYAPAEFQVFRVEEVDEDGALRVTKLVEFPVRS